MTGCVPAMWAILATLVIAPAIMVTVGIVVMMAVGIRPPTPRMIARVEQRGYASPIDWPLAALIAAMIPLGMVGLVVAMAAAPSLLTACVALWQAVAAIVGIGAVGGAVLGWIIGTDERLLEAVRIVTTAETVGSDERAVDYLAQLIAEADAEIEETAGAELADEIPAVPGLVIPWTRDYLAALIAEADAEIEETAGAELADEVEAWLRDGAR